MPCQVELPASHGRAGSREVRDVGAPRPVWAGSCWPSGHCHPMQPCVKPASIYVLAIICRRFCKRPLDHTRQSLLRAGWPAAVVHGVGPARAKRSAPYPYPKLSIASGVMGPMPLQIDATTVFPVLLCDHFHGVWRAMCSGRLRARRSAGHGQCGACPECRSGMLRDAANPAIGAQLI